MGVLAQLTEILERPVVVVPVSRSREDKAGNGMLNDVRPTGEKRQKSLIACFFFFFLSFFPFSSFFLFFVLPTGFHLGSLLGSLVTMEELQNL